jgi:hypothetical protein
MIRWSDKLATFIIGRIKAQTYGKSFLYPASAYDAPHLSHYRHWVIVEGPHGIGVAPAAPDYAYMANMAQRLGLPWRFDADPEWLKFGRTRGSR